MSESARSYAGPLRSSPAVRPQRTGCFRYLFLLLIVAFGVYAYWITRDTHEKGEFVQQNPKYAVVITDLLAKRDNLAASAIWDALPAEWDVSRQLAALTRDTALPSWVLNHFIGEESIFAGANVDRLDDLVFITKMRFLGCLMERLHRWLPGIEPDYAGGLRLRHLPDAEMYYAVRGRVLLLSPSRQALVRALTLRPEDTMGEEMLAETLGVSGAEDMRGAVLFEPGDAAGHMLRSLSFALRIEPEAAHLRCRAVLHPEWEQRIDPLFDGADTRALRRPPDGMVMLSANFGKNIEEVWTTLGSATEIPLFSAETWDNWRQLDEGEAPGPAYFLTALTGGAGPGIALTWHSIDVNEIVPMPVLAGLFEANTVQFDALLNALPDLPSDAMPWDPYPRVDTAARRVHLPMPGGRSIEPTAALLDGALFVSTSGSLADELLAQGPDRGVLEQRGNLFIQVKPLALADAIVNAGRVLTGVDALRGYTRQSFDAAAAGWLERAAQLEEIRLLAYVEDEHLGLDLDVLCPAAAQTAGGSQAAVVTQPPAP